MPDEKDTDRHPATHRGGRGPAQMSFSSRTIQHIALVTMNQLILEDRHGGRPQADPRNNRGIPCVYAKSGKARREVCWRREVKESAAQMQQGLQNDIHVAGLKAREYVHLVNEAHRRPALIRWSASPASWPVPCYSAAAFGLGRCCIAALRGLDMWILVCCSTCWDGRNFCGFLAGWMLIMLFFLYCFVHEAFDQPRPTQHVVVRTYNVGPCPRRLQTTNAHARSLPVPS